MKPRIFKEITNDEIYEGIMKLHRKLDNQNSCIKICEEKIKHNTNELAQLRDLGKLFIGAVISGFVGIGIFVLNLISGIK
jgi:hypothetical protein